MSHHVAQEPLEVIAGRLLQRAGLTLALAESCTGGLVAHRVTSVAGASVYFLGGVVSYSNAAKEHILGVSGETLAQYGAVSEECAREMAEGARRLFGADLAIGVTGILGPAGGSPAKPVGLVYIAFAGAEGTVCRRFQWDGDRLGNKEQSAEAALALLVEGLGGSPATQAAEPDPRVIEVEALSSPGGAVRPLRFWLAGTTHEVLSIGRSWDVPAEGRHILVMDERQRTHELLLRPDGTWRLVATFDAQAGLA